MAPAKSKSANGSAAKGNASATSTNGTTTQVLVTANGKKDTSDATPVSSGGKPDKKAYDVEQERLKSEIDTLQVKLVSQFCPDLSFGVLTRNISVCGQREDLSRH